MLNSVHADVLFLGLEGAYDRLSAAGNAEKAFAATFEAPNWISSIDDRFGLVTGDKDEWLDRAVGQSSTAGGKTLSGLRYARKAVHHHWSESLEFKHGAQFPINLRSSQLFGEWIWTPVAPPKNPKGEFDYSLLIGQSSRLTVQNAATLFAIHANLVGATTPSWLVPDKPNQE